MLKWNYIILIISYPILSHHYITATVSLTILITYLEYFGFVTRVNQKRVHDLVTRDINTKLSRLNDTTGVLELPVM
jgi:hypothetical protein